MSLVFRLRFLLWLVLIVALGLAIFGSVGQLPSDLAHASAAAGGPGHHPCTNPTTKTSDPQGHAGPYGHSVLSQDVWDNINISQTLYACNKNSWYVTASASASGDNGAVQSYPDTNVTLSAPLISSFTSMTSNFRVYGTPPSCTGNDYEYASDDWIGDANEWSDASTHTELMIWHYTCNQVPAGTDVGTTTINGRAFSVWLAGGLGQSNGDIVTFKAQKNYTSDQTDVLAFLQYAQSQGWLVSDPHFWQDGEGAEICYTNGQQTFGLEAFNLRINGQPVS